LANSLWKSEQVMVVLTWSLGLEGCGRGWRDMPCPATARWCLGNYLISQTLCYGSSARANGTPDV